MEKVLVNPLKFFCLLVVVLLFLPACQGRKTVQVIDPTGVYSLVSVNGSTLPATVTHGEATLEVRSGSFTISTDKTCISKMIFVAPNGAEVNRVVKATYTCEGSTLTMQWERAGQTLGTVIDDTFTMNNEGMIFAYKK